MFFSAIFLGMLLLSIRINKTSDFFSKETTNQLKGVAIFTVIFAHIGYFLSADTRFLYPFSVAGGVGVNIFLFLSGFGLTVSQISNSLPIFSFYKKRLLRLFFPLWIVISALFLLDFLILHRTYPTNEIIASYIGFFPGSDVFINIDSPLWYITIILFYYFVFPLTFIKRFPLLSPILVLLASLFILNMSLPVNEDTLKLYKLHTLAFPAGILFGLFYQKIKINFNKYIKFGIIIISFLVFLYTSINSGIGEDPKIEQSISLLTTLSLMIFFSLIKFNFKLLSIFGILSYEIYLIHWPILSRFNLFSSLPPLLMVSLNLLLLSALGYGLQKLKR